MGRVAIAAECVVVLLLWNIDAIDCPYRCPCLRYPAVEHWRSAAAVVAAAVVAVVVAGNFVWQTAMESPTGRTGGEYHCLR